MQNSRLDEAQAGIKIARRNINNLRYSDDTTLMAEGEEKLKSLLMKVKEESEKACLNSPFKNSDHGIWSHHFMATRWGNNGDCGYVTPGTLSVSWGYPGSPWKRNAKKKNGCMGRPYK